MFRRTHVRHRSQLEIQFEEKVIAVTVNQIRKALETRPFKPFVLLITGGREYCVPHPEFLMITPPGRTIVVADRDGAVEIIDLILVESLHFTNGRSRSRKRRS